jgi:hypothetical protein
MSLMLNYETLERNRTNHVLSGRILLLDSARRHDVTENSGVGQYIRNLHNIYICIPPILVFDYLRVGKLV